MCTINMKHEPFKTKVTSETAREVRKANKLTQKALGKMLGIDQSLVSKIETGTVDITDKTKLMYLAKLNEVCGDISGVVLSDLEFGELVNTVDYLNNRIEQLTATNSRIKEQNSRLKQELKTARKIFIDNDWFPRKLDDYDNECCCDGNCDTCICSKLDDEAYDIANKN